MNELIAVIKQVQREPKAFQSDWARSKARMVAEASSRGYITCLQAGVNKGCWMATATGVELAERGEA